MGRNLRKGVSVVMATIMRQPTRMLAAGEATPASTATPVRLKEAEIITLLKRPPPVLASASARSSRFASMGSWRRRAKVEQMEKCCTYATTAMRMAEGRTSAKSAPGVGPSKGSLKGGSVLGMLPTIFTL